MSIQLNGVLHCYQPFRDLYDVTYIPLDKRFDYVHPRRLIPQPNENPLEDWNIHKITPQCYRPLANGGVFERLVFNIGPTLLKDLWVHAPDVYDKIIESERISTDRFGGHSNALAQASPNHAILPLAKKEDKLVNIKWAIAEYEMHYKKRPEGVWLPETAVDEETLALLADEGIKYVVLAPKQAKQFRKIGEDQWHDAEWEGRRIDTGVAYKICFEDKKFIKKNISVFFYDGNFSGNIGYPNEHNKWIYDSSENFLYRWLAAKGDFKHFGVDGETFGHHQKGKAELLSGAVQLIDNSQNGDWQGAEFINYGLFLEKNPPEMEVQIYNNSAWSCNVELNRWGQTVREQKEHNGYKWTEDRYCNLGITNWHPSWRIQFRNALEDLNIRLKLVYERAAPKHLKDPEQAALDYGSIVSNSRSFHEFFEIHKTRNANIEKAYMLLEMKKFMQYMFTSCGWFHEYVNRIEPFTNLLCANSAIRIAEQLAPDSGIEKDFLSRLSSDMSQIYLKANEVNNQRIKELDSLKLKQKTAA